MRPLSHDFVVSTGRQLHELLKAKRILHLFYAGFYANMCVQYRDYGVSERGKRGYNSALIRGHATATESHDTVDKFLIIEQSIGHIEMFHGFTVSSEDFIRAWRKISQADDPTSG